MDGEWVDGEWGDGGMGGGETTTAGPLFLFLQRGRNKERVVGGTGLQFLFVPCW